MKIPKSIQADLALVGITVVWGSTFTIVKESLALVSPMLFVAIRFWIATVILLVSMPRQAAGLNGKSIRQGVVLSVFLLGGFVFQTLGLRSTNPSYSAFITSLSVLLVPLFGFLLFRNRPRFQTLCGIILATLGLYLMLVQWTEFNLGSGDTLTMICAILFAFHILFLGRYVSATDYRQLMIVQMAAAAIVCTLLIPVLERPYFLWTPRLMVYFFVTGVLSTTVAFYVQARSQQFTTANRTALIFSLEPFFAALFAYWILGQILTIREWIGGGLILTGILVSELRPVSPPVLAEPSGSSRHGAA